MRHHTFRSRTCWLCNTVMLTYDECSFPLKGDHNGICADHKLQTSDFTLIYTLKTNDYLRFSIFEKDVISEIGSLIYKILPEMDVYYFRLGYVIMKDWDGMRFSAHYVKYIGPWAKPRQVIGTAPTSTILSNTIENRGERVISFDEE